MQAQDGARAKHACIGAEDTAARRLPRGARPWSHRPMRRPLRPRSLVRPLLALLGLVAAGGLGCAPSLSTFQPAHVADKGHAQVALGAEVSIPTATIDKVVNQAKPLTEAARTRDLTVEEQRKVFEAGINLAANPPSGGVLASGAYVPVRNLEVNLRYASSAWRLGARYQLLERARAGVDLTLGAGFSRYKYQFPVGDQIPFLRLEDFVRWQLDVPLQIGQAGSWYRWWAGPKAMFTSFETTLQIAAPFYKSEVASFRGTGGYYGGQAGIALGYKYAFLAFELTMAQLFGHADTTLLGSSVRTNVDSFVVFPTFGLLGEF